MYHGGDGRRPKLSNRLEEFVVWEDPSVDNPLARRGKAPPLTPIENEYMLMFTALEEWKICPWLAPNGDIFPEIRNTMFHILNYRNIKMKKEMRKAQRKK